MVRRPRIALLAAAASIAALSIACAQLLGIETIHDDAPDASTADASRGDESSVTPIVDAFVEAETSVTSDGSNDVHDAGPSIDPARGCTSPDGAPVRFFPSVSTFPVGLAADDVNLYVADQNGIRRCGLEGCEAGVFTVTSTTPKGLAADGQHVIYADNNDLAIADMNGFTAQGFVAVGVVDIVAHGTSLYWTDGKRVNYAVDEPDASVTTIYFDDPGTTTTVAADSKYTFFIDYADASSSGRVMRCSSTDCDGGPTFIAAVDRFDASAGLVPGASLAADDKSVYWSDPGMLALRACDVTGCQSGVRTIASDVRVVDVIADGTAVYWSVTDPGGDVGTIFKLPAGAATPILVTETFRLPNHLVANAACIYWTTSSIPSIPHGGAWASRQP